jgi:hypothetical protein
MASAMDAVTQNQIAAAQQTGQTVSAAREIVSNARSLQEMTIHILDKFDSYMTSINQIRQRDENYEKRTADLLNRIQQENKDLSKLIADLGSRISLLTADSGEASLKEISSVLSSMQGNVKSIHTTLSSLAKEA